MEKIVAIYVRISTQLQHLDRQVEELTSYANNLHYKIYNVYEDVITGFQTKEKRPQLLQLIKDAKEGLFELILFSEFSRLGRNQMELNRLINGFHNLDIEMYFHKQNLAIHKKEFDINTKMTLYVLGLISEYEIKLFAERSISGKISALKNRGINIGGFCNYGYTTDKVSKKMIIDKDEAKVVKRIFEMYNEGKSQHEICDILNDLGTPAPYFTRLNNANNRRKEKGFKEKDYNGKDNSIWIISSLNRILKNEIYIGKRFFEFYKPNVDKYVDKEIDDLFKIEENKKEDIEIKREILEQFEISDKDLSIISDDLFYSIQNKLILNRTNKNPELKHKNLLKSKLKCGVCGSNWAVGKQNNYQIYRCYGTYKGSVSRKKICFDSLQIMQSKLNGLVVRLSIHRFAEMQIENNSQSKIDDLKRKISESNNFICIKEKELCSIKEIWLNWFNKAIKFNIDDDIIMDKKKEYDMVSISIIKQIDRYKKEVVKYSEIIKSISKMNNENSLLNKMRELLDRKDLIKQMIDDYIDEILIYPLYQKYSLVIVRYIDGSESWGSIKSARYSKNEFFIDSIFAPVPEYIGLFYYNEFDKFTCIFDYEKKIFHYIAENKTLLGDTKLGDYSIEEFISLLKEHEATISFVNYDYN